MTARQTPASSRARPWPSAALEAGAEVGAVAQHAAWPGNIIRFKKN